MNRNILILLLTLLIVTPLHAHTAISHLLSHPSLQGASVGVVVLDVASGEVLASHQPDERFTPASLLKVVTTATALQLYGSDYQFATALEARGTIDQWGTLHGSLHLVGSGSPTLGSEWGSASDAAFLSLCVEAVQQAGIKRIAGQVVADASRLGSEGVSPKWLWEDMGNYYAAGVYALNYADNLYRLTLRSTAVGSTPTVVATQPPMDITFQNQLVAAPNSKDSAYIYGAPFSSQRYLYGSIPAQRSSFVIKGDIPNPPQHLAQTLVAKLTNSGIAVDSGATYTFASPQASQEGVVIPIYTHQSLPLGEIVAVTNQRSNNLYAESLLRLVAQQAATTATATQGVAQLRSYWQQQGIATSSLTMYDGSGLSPLNVLSPRFIAEVLRWVKLYSPYVTTFEQSLPTVGQTGTVRNLLYNTALAGKLHLKSGSMQGVLCYAGYSDSGKVVVVMINNYTTERTAVQRQIEEMLLSLPL